MKAESISADEFKETSKKKNKAKYRNVKTVVDGITFDSKKEASRYKELKLMEKSGEIRNLTCQEKFSLTVNHQIGFGISRMTHICNYKADFKYEKTELQHKEEPYFLRSVTVVEDVKSEITRKNPVYRIKKKLMKAIYGIDIVEV